MIPPLVRPNRRNPIVRTRQPLLPPGVRSRAALGLTAAAALGRFELQVCGDCGAVQYPPREMCHRCLTGTLRWREQSGTGELIAETTVHHRDRKSTRLNSSHQIISYAVFCLKKKKKKHALDPERE